MQTLLILLGIFITIQIFLDKWLRKKFNARKKEWFSYNYVNKLHIWLDWSLRFVMLTAVIITFVITTYSVETSEYIILPWIILWIYAIVEGLLRTFMEWKYYPNSKDYIVTLINTTFLFFFMCICYVWIMNQI